MQPEDFWKFSSTRKLFQGNNNSNLAFNSGTKVTDILIRGGGGTITFSDGVTVEYLFGFIPDDTVAGGGRFGITLEGVRAQLLYQNILTQSLCETIDWLLDCSDLNRRVSLLELNAGVAKKFKFEIPDWAAGTTDAVEVPNALPLGDGQIGAHDLGIGRAFHVTVWKDDGTPIIVGVDTELKINFDTGLITVKKSPLGNPFAGWVIVS